jgi:hypothetical protein
MSPSVPPKRAKDMSGEELIAFLRSHFYGPIKRRLKKYKPYLLRAHKIFSQPGRRVPIKGLPSWTEFCERELGVSIRTIQRLLAGDESPKPRYNAAGIRRLEAVVVEAQKVVDADPENKKYAPMREAMAGKRITKDTANAVDGKHYWLSRPELLEAIRAEFGDFYDPCPFPRPKNFNGLKVDWQKVNYVNPPFYGEVVDGEKVGMTAWTRKAIEEQAKGNTSILVYPLYGWFHSLVRSGVEIRTLGEVKWLATEDRTPQPRSSHQIAMFVLRGNEP